jgi:hypothetical protein
LARPVGAACASHSFLILTPSDGTLRLRPASIIIIAIAPALGVAPLGGALQEPGEEESKRDAGADEHRRLPPGESFDVLHQSRNVTAAHRVGELLQPCCRTLDVFRHGWTAVLIELLRGVARGIGHAVNIVGDAHLALFDI